MSRRREESIKRSITYLDLFDGQLCRCQTDAEAISNNSTSVSLFTWQIEKLTALLSGIICGFPYDAKLY